MSVSTNRGTPKWMVKIMENPIKMDDLGVPLFSETSISTLIKVMILSLVYPSKAPTGWCCFFLRASAVRSFSFGDLPSTPKKHFESERGKKKQMMEA